MPRSLDGIQIIQNRQTREYEEFRTDALELAASLTPEWTDFYPHDPGVVIIEALASLADQVSYYADRVLHEGFWGYAQLRDSVIKHGELIGYTFQPPSSSIVDVDVTVSGAVTLPGIDTITEAPMSVGNEANQNVKQFTFELIEEFSAPGAGTYTLSFIEGRTVFRETLGSSDGTPGQVFTLGRRGLTLNSDGNLALRVEVYNGVSWVSWSNVKDFRNSTSTDLDYKVYQDEDGYVFISFGDDTNGAIPTTGSQNIRVTYRIGGGSESNYVGVGRINKALTSPATVTSVTNAANPSGGSDRTTIQEARVEGPDYFKTQDRAITHLDYEAFAVTVAGVHKARATYYRNILVKEAVYIAAEGLNPVPTGTWDPARQSGTGLLGAVGKLLNTKKAASVQLYILPFTALSVNCSVEVYIDNNFYQNDVEARVTTAIQNYVRGTSTTDAEDILPLSGLNKLIEDIEGVNYVNVTYFHRQPYVEEANIGLANTTYSDVVTGSTMREEVWTIFMQTPTTFTVHGTTSGPQTLTGTLGSEYTTDNGELRFTLTAGSIANKYGDMYKIVTSAYAGNIELQDHEIAVIDTPTVSIIGGIR